MRQRFSLTACNRAAQSVACGLDTNGSHRTMDKRHECIKGIAGSDPEAQPRGVDSPRLLTHDAMVRRWRLGHAVPVSARIIEYVSYDGAWWRRLGAVWEAIPDGPFALALEAGRSRFEQACCAAGVARPHLPEAGRHGSVVGRADSPARRRLRSCAGVPADERDRGPAAAPDRLPVPDPLTASEPASGVPTLTASSTLVTRRLQKVTSSAFLRCHRADAERSPGFIRCSCDRVAGVVRAATLDRIRVGYLNKIPATVVQTALHLVALAAFVTLAVTPHRTAGYLLALVGLLIVAGRGSETGLLNAIPAVTLLAAAVLAPLPHTLTTAFIAGRADLRDRLAVGAARRSAASPASAPSTWPATAEPRRLAIPADAMAAANVIVVAAIGAIGYANWPVWPVASPSGSRCSAVASVTANVDVPALARRLRHLALPDRAGPARAVVHRLLQRHHRPGTPAAVVAAGAGRDRRAIPDRGARGRVRAQAAAVRERRRCSTARQCRPSTPPSSTASARSSTSTTPTSTATSRGSASSRTFSCCTATRTSRPASTRSRRCSTGCSSPVRPASSGTPTTAWSSPRRSSTWSGDRRPTRSPTTRHRVRHHGAVRAHDTRPLRRREPLLAARRRGDRPRAARRRRHRDLATRTRASTAGPGGCAARRRAGLLATTGPGPAARTCSAPRPTRCPRSRR